jgi:GNAT superfamily N-acetyltransferase
MPKQAITDEEIERCFPVMAQLRPALERQGFVTLVRRMEQEGFRLAYLEEDGEVVAVAGYRIYTNLALGKHLYVDDLVAAESRRSRGHGRALLDWLRAQARASGCRVLHLDSGTQRRGAHKFYFREGLLITSFHFAEELEREQ